MPREFEAGDTSNKSDENSQGAPSGSDQNFDRSSSGGEQRASNVNQDYETLNKRFNDSQEFIGTLKTENKDMREKLSAALETIEQLQEQVQSQPSMDDILEQVRQSGDSNTNAVDPDKIVEQAVQKMEQSLTQKEQNALMDKNFDSVKTALEGQFGKEGLKTKVTELAAENGLSYEQYVRMAETSPKAALKLFGVEGTPSAPTPGKGSVNTYAHDAHNANTSPPRKGNIMDMRTDKDRVAYLDGLFKEAGVN